LRSHPEAKKYWVDSGDPALRARLAQEFAYRWELYDVEGDRSELHDVADQHPDLVRELRTQWQSWADRVGVIPFETILDIYAQRGQPYKDAIG